MNSEFEKWWDECSATHSYFEDMSFRTVAKNAWTASRARALEEAAKVCDAGAEQYAIDGYEEHADEARRLATKIRALALSPSPEGASGGA